MSNGETITEGQERSDDRSWFLRLVRGLTGHRRKEGPSAFLFFAYAFLLLTSYYVLKTLREPLLLGTSSAEIKSYAYATIAMLLLLCMPLYGALYRHLDGRRLIRCITVFFILNLAVFSLVARGGVDVGFSYYVWVGIFGVMIIAQFWAHAADSFNVETGQRLFPFIMAGATLGGLTAPPLVSALYPLWGPWPLVLIVMILLAATLPLVGATRSSVPPASRNATDASASPSCPHPLRGIRLVMQDRYLLLLAVLVVLLNCVNSVGEYILTDFVVHHADVQAATDSARSRGDLIASFYGEFYFLVNASTLIIQVFLVGTLFRWIGVRGSMLVLPLIAFVGYGLAVFMPIFSIIRVVKILENSTDYSVMNTARHALYLPLSPEAKYESKTIIDTFFWRFGDVLQAGLIFVGLNELGFEVQQFAVLNMFLALVWIAVAAAIGREYSARIRGLDRRGPLDSLVSTSSPPVRARVPRTVFVDGRGLIPIAATLMLGLIVFAAPPAVAGGGGDLFSSHHPLEIELRFERRAFCRNPEKKGCIDTPGELVVVTPSGREAVLPVRIRSRGRWRAETGNCRFPALFVYFSETTGGSAFAGQEMLPLTMPCQASAAYEQYVLKEYLAYRIYNLLTDKSLRVRLARVTYHDTTGRKKPFERWGFFTEHFDDLAARHGAEVWRPEQLDLLQVDADDLAVLDLFQYMIGNLDWSAIFQHNIVVMRTPAGVPTPVPYDFDFSGLVDAPYAGPPPGLPIESLDERLFRGVCRADTDWANVLSDFEQAQGKTVALVDKIRELEQGPFDALSRYLDDFFKVIGSAETFHREVGAVCRPITQPAANENSST